MKLNFKKIASVLASAVMLTSTVGFAAALNYPAPFSSTGGAVVYGSNAYVTDATAAFKVEKSIQGTSSTTTTTTTSGETTPLFSGTKLYANDSLNTVKQSLSSTSLPTVLAQGNFNGNVQVTYQQTIALGSTPMIKFGNYPTTDDAASYALVTSSNTATPIYNLTVTFSQPVNFTDSKSKNRQITLFGQKYTVGSSTTSTKLVLLNSATTLNFDSTGTTSGQVTIGGNTYTVELVNVDSSGNAAITVTAADGTSASDTVAKGDSSTINGLSIGVVTATSSNQKYTASIVAGADKLTIPASGDNVKYGDSDKTIEGTAGYINGGTGAASSITVSIATKGSDYAALKQGQTFTDPVFKTIKLDFSAGMSVGDNDTSREVLQVVRSADDKLQVKGLLQDSSGNPVSFNFVKNQSNGLFLQNGDSAKNITVVEGGTAYYGEFIVVPGSQDAGKLVKVTGITNASTTTVDDSVTLTDVATGVDYPVTISTTEGLGSVTIGDRSFTVNYFASPSTGDQNTRSITLVQSNAGTSRTVYPTLKTPNGNAEVAFYTPVPITLSSGVTSIKLPNGNGVTPVTVAAGSGYSQWTIGGNSITTNGSITSSSVTVGAFTYNFTTSGNVNQTTLYVLNPTGGNDASPGLLVFEGKDDASAYNALLVTTAASGTKVGVNNVLRTWTGGTDALFKGSNPDNTYLTYKADRYGTIVTLDTTTSDQKSALISVPTEEIYGNVYMGSTDAVVSGGSSSGGSGLLTAVEDKDIASVQNKNLIVVGGSCVNKAAAKILTNKEDPVCGADFTALTQVGSSQYIIKTVTSPYNSANIAVLVAGYEAVDTINAVDTLLEGAKTDVNSSQVYPIAATTP